MGRLKRSGNKAEPTESLINDHCCHSIKNPLESVGEHRWAGYKKFRENKVRAIKNQSERKEQRGRRAPARGSEGDGAKDKEKARRRRGLARGVCRLRLG